MEWLLIVGLGVWIYVQGRGVADLRRRLEALEARRVALAPETPASSAIATKASPWVATPVEPPLEPSPEPAPALASGVPPRTIFEPRPAIAAKKTAPPRLNLAAWISEHGLAWLGGGALVLGGLFLVTYAAQRGVFTPAMRIAAAVVLGFVMIGASEWVRRLDRAWAGRDAPAAALLAGAGAATLYGAIWASDRLYGFISVEASAPLLGMVSAGLLALAFRHGAPLAVAALVGAYLAPVVTNGPDWGDGPLAAYLVLILVTGYATAALRRWDEAAWVAGAGAVIWAMANLGDAQDIPAALLLFLSPALAIAAGLWRRRGEAPATEPLSERAFAWRLTPAAVLAISSLISLSLWLPGVGSIHASQAGLLSAGLAILGALLAVTRLGPSVGQIAPYAAIPLALHVAALNSTAGSRGVIHWPDSLVLAGLGAILALILSAFAAARGARDKVGGWSAGSGAVCAALALLCVAIGFDPARFHLAWGAAAVGGGLMALAAAWLGRRAEGPDRDLGLALWIWSATFLAARALDAGLQGAALPPALGLLTLATVGLHSALRWRGFSSAALAAALAVLASLMFDVAGPALSGDMTPWMAAAVVAAAAGLVWAADRLVRRDGRDRAVAEALGAAALIAALIGGFLLLRFWGEGGKIPAGGLDALTEAGLGTILLLAAGLVSARGGESLIGRYRGPFFLVLGLLHGLIAQGLVANPLWASGDGGIQGPPIFDAIMLAYLAPAAMLAAAVRLRVSPQRALIGIYAAGSLVFGLLWAGLELRRLFQGPSLHAGLDAIGRAEGAAYALLMLIVARLLFGLMARMGQAPGGLARIEPEAGPMTEALGWVAAVAAAMVFGYGASPWWGPITRPFVSHGGVVLLLALYAAGVVAWLSLVRQPLLGRFARPAVVLQLFVLLTLSVRYGFRGLDMATAMAEARLETWAFSAIWALYGLAVLVLGARLRDLTIRWTGLAILLFTTAKVFIFDMARLDGVVRAASFLALGALLIIAALAARRFGGLGLKAASEEQESAPA